MTGSALPRQCRGATQDNSNVPGIPPLQHGLVYGSVLYLIVLFRWLVREPDWELQTTTIF